MAETYKESFLDVAYTCIPNLKSPQNISTLLPHYIPLSKPFSLPRCQACALWVQWLD